MGLGPNGVIAGSEQTRETFNIVLSSGITIDLLLFIHKICMEWEGEFSSDPDQNPLPPHGSFLLTQA